MVSDGKRERSFVNQLTCEHCQITLELNCPMIIHRDFQRWVCRDCHEEKRLGIEGASSFLKFLRGKRERRNSKSDSNK